MGSNNDNAKSCNRTSEVNGRTGKVEKENLRDVISSVTCVRKNRFTAGRAFDGHRSLA